MQHNKKHVNFSNNNAAKIAQDSSIHLLNMPDLEISGNGCKDVIINPDGKIGNITVPNGVKIHRPKTTKEYLDLRDKLIH